jgi:hypothetical protein
MTVITSQNNMEYHFQSSLGLVAITPCPGLPSAVELRIAGKIWATYVSAEFAARAVASSSTGHEQLDDLPCSRVPALLSCWKQSLPLNFNTDASRAESLEDPVLADEHAVAEMNLAF